MDIKALHDVLIERNIPITQDSLFKAEREWTFALASNELDLTETFEDYLAEMDEDKYKTMITTIMDSVKDIDFIGHISTPTLVTSYAAGLSLVLAHVGKGIVDNHLKQVGKFVNQHSQDWLADCAAYARDMEEQNNGN